ncbi:hypothetical protein LOTGIDRAFT_213961 [Lottia gigantea]|uniref:Peptidase M12B domain-containing protein n=1 Tax=Lottia gigantea TaxID=225164 RepID=V4AXN5_LOTGI|nr:hypothetical protein LOTGIDRAFT_213961 [Lottia gigantea]ESO98336.1 hypothetical protein LOTGIDRAFT_213961 [Lottia gigantea]
MVAKHGQQNITTYILSIFNIVSKLFEDNSLGKPVEILLVGLVLLEDNEPGLHINNHADYTLNSFCQWQSTLSDSTGRRHDHAILLTGLDICSYKNSPCDTLGFAPINGMCNPLRSCIMSEDSGLATAFTITHELGHNFGMFHDGEGNECKSQGGNIMAPTLTGNKGIFQWSSCSRDYFLRFLNTVQSTCLSDRPDSIAEFKFPEKLPGELYDATTQCKWLFGNDAQACLYDFGDNKMCQSLWCYRSNHMCETKFLPAAEGTECGLGMWCRQSRCERKVFRNKDVNGGWSDWTSWTLCSRTCGGGIQERSRKCNNPKPEYNGKPCLGDSQMYKLCNIQECKDNKDYRQEQCEDYNRKLFRGWYYSWKKYKKYIQKVEDQCKLYCQAEDYNFFFALNNKVKDGTLCSDYSDRRCIKGSCKDYGCDLVFDSETHHDRCGVCQGDNSTCSLITGVFNDQIRQNAYQHIITLPIGARKIKIEETKPSSNYLVLRNKYGDYYINGNRQISTPGVYNIGGSRFQYEDTDQQEKLESDGPLKEYIVLEMLSRGVNYGIKYEYSLDKRLSRISMDEYQYSYRWNTILSTCSHSCAGGIQNVSVECMRSDNKVVNDLNCDDNIKPSTPPRQCSKSPCPARWETSNWGECSKKCGGGKQKRTIRCWQKISQDKDIKIKPRFCKHIPKQSKKRYCNQHDCKPRWMPAKWSQCSVTCGQGHKTRDVSCKKKTVQGNVEISDTHCKDLARPSQRKHCYRRGACLLRLNERVISYQWLITSWGKCSTTCDNGIKRRMYRCSRVASRGHYRRVSDYYCQNVHKPRNTPLITHCLLPPCQKSIWKTGPWTQCSVSCGEGMNLRTVRCVDNVGNTTNDCPLPKPDSKKNCQQSACFSSSQGQSSCSDEFQWCHLVPVHKICSHSYYGSKCCKSCRGHS